MGPRRAQAGLARLSLNNQLLVALSRPDATFVAGFKAWLKLDHAHELIEFLGAAGYKISVHLAPEALYPFESHYAKIDDASVHYVDEGNGPPLVLIHGNPTWSFLCREIITGLRDRYRCIAPDYPGFGLSRAAPGYGYAPTNTQPSSRSSSCGLTCRR
jgi:alpha/beta hydrolase fold